MRVLVLSVLGTHFIAVFSTGHSVRLLDELSWRMEAVQVIGDLFLKGTPNNYL